MRTTSYLCLFGSLLTGAVNAQTPAIPPDYFGDTIPSVHYRANDGQLIDTEGDLRPDVLGYSEGSAIKLYARENSEVSFVMAGIDGDTATADTLYRIDMVMAAEADPVAPQFLFELPGITNYYYPHTAPDGVTEVPAYTRVVYEAIYPKIDFHLYSGSRGPRMCWVVWPGGDPNDIMMLFEGQDSLHVDWQGTLNIYADGRELKLDSAKAYQFQGSSINPVAGGADYIEVGGNDFIQFVVDSFDTSLPLVIQVGAPPMMGGGGGTDEWRTTLGTWIDPANGDVFINASVGLPDGDVVAAGNTTDFAYPVRWSVKTGQELG